MRDGLIKNLNAIFAGREATVLTEDRTLADWLGTHGVAAETLDGLSASGKSFPPQVLAAPLAYGGLPSRRELREMLAQSSVLWMPLASFSSDLDTAKYAFEMFAESDVTRSVATNRRVITQLLLAQKEVRFSGPDTALKVQLPDFLQAASRTRLNLLPDEHSTIGNYFEVALSPTDVSGRVDSALSVSGSFRIDTVLAGKHRELAGDRAAHFTAATEIAADMRKACPLQLTVVDNRVVGGFGEWARSIDAMSGPEYHGAITEIAVGTAALPLDRVDWGRNSQLNESAAGIHLGVGNGITGIHFDFVSTEAWLDGA